MKTIKHLIFCIIFLNSIFSYGAKLVGVQEPVAKEDIIFEVQVTEATSVEAAELNFGNILKNSNQVQTARSSFNLKTSYSEDMLVSTSYRNTQEVGDFSKLIIYQKGMTSGDSLEIYLSKLKKNRIAKGEIKIPILGEIRSVGDIQLGAYEGTVIMDVEINPVNPIIKLGK